MLSDPSQVMTLTNTDGSELGGNQRTGAELVVGRNGGAVEVAISTSGLEGSGSSDGRGRGAGADRRLTEGKHGGLSNQEEEQ